MDHSFTQYYQYIPLLSHCLCVASTYSNLSNLSVPDVRGMVKTLVCGMKTITWGVKAYKTPANCKS